MSKKNASNVTVRLRHAVVWKAEDGIREDFAGTEISVEAKVAEELVKTGAADVVHGDAPAAQDPPPEQ